MINIVVIDEIRKEFSLANLRYYRHYTFHHHGDYNIGVWSTLANMTYAARQYNI